MQGCLTVIAVILLLVFVWLAIVTYRSGGIHTIEPDRQTYELESTGEDTTAQPGKVDREVNEPDVAFSAVPVEDLPVTQPEPTRGQEFESLPSRSSEQAQFYNLPGLTMSLGRGASADTLPMPAMPAPAGQQENALEKSVLWAIVGIPLIVALVLFVPYVYRSIQIRRMRAAAVQTHTGAGPQHNNFPLAGWPGDSLPGAISTGENREGLIRSLSVEDYVATLTRRPGSS